MRKSSPVAMPDTTEPGASVRLCPLSLSDTSMALRVSTVKYDNRGIYLSGPWIITDRLSLEHLFRCEFTEMSNPSCLAVIAGPFPAALYTVVLVHVLKLLEVHDRFGCLPSASDADTRCMR